MPAKQFEIDLAMGQRIGPAKPPSLTCEAHKQLDIRRSEHRQAEGRRTILMDLLKTTKVIWRQATQANETM